MSLKISSKRFNLLFHTNSDFLQHITSEYKVHFQSTSEWYLNIVTLDLNNKIFHLKYSSNLILYI